MAIPVICDRCRVTGFAGGADFSHFGDLLDFVPVPRRPRVNGWDAEAQRAFIGLLAATGSKRRAATAIGRNAFGVDQLLKAPGNDGFRAAFDRAMAIAKANGAMKLSLDVADAAARSAHLTPPSRLRGHAPEDERKARDEAASDRNEVDLLQNLLKKYLLKVLSERKERLAGNVVAADFYLRQISFFEVAIDLTASELGRCPFELLVDLRRGDHDLFHIAQTPFSRLLDERRRALWAHMAEPARPEHPPRRYLQDHGDHSSQPLQYWNSGEGHASPAAATKSFNAHQARLADQHAADAEAQVEWERRAAADAAEWRAAEAT